MRSKHPVAQLSTGSVQNRFSPDGFWNEKHLSRSHPRTRTADRVRDVLRYRASVISLLQSVISRLHFLLFEKPLKKKKKKKTGPQFSIGRMSHESKWIAAKLSITDSQLQIFKQVLHENQTEGLRGFWTQSFCKQGQWNMALKSAWLASCSSSSLIYA